MRFIQLLVLASVVFGVAHADSSGQSNENPFGGNDDNGVYSLPEGQGSNEGPESIQGVRRKRGPKAAPVVRHPVPHHSESEEGSGNGVRSSSSEEGSGSEDCHNHKHHRGHRHGKDEQRIRAPVAAPVAQPAPSRHS
ncbi:unnamed protein product [Bursaphelenchus xylophilus]|uniref:(pine wood nematode) hypothetical protein n=1 Tax=Bursaphelenchus xylophilus TaxID=6326 RepID=A0A1I7SI76_BURXY|nr:unnamed protein product [Bursaphelenchus xylophilus]CAG9100220.1 unnamed protein product [Bursaphelenchus xylophilus]